VKTSLSAVAVVREALLAAQASMRAYSHKNSPKKYTQHQLFALLVLKEFFKTTYRGVWGLIRDSQSLRDAIELKHTPHWTTIQKACDRLLTARRTQRLIDHTVEKAIRIGKMKAKPRRVAIDSSGFESQHVSRYYAKRREKTDKSGKKKRITMRRFPKLAIAVDCASHFIVGAVANQGPSPDFGYFEPLVLQTVNRVWPKTILADAGFDSEASHELCRDEFEIQSLIPATHGRPTDKEPSGYWRRQMKRHLAQSSYGQRWQAETGFSMIKRRVSEVALAMTYHRKRRLLLLKTITLNLMLLCYIALFY
jgi:hypothetical protein